MNRNLYRAAAPAALVFLALAACGGQNEAEAGGPNAEGVSTLSGEVLVDGSSTVQPLTAAAGELFKET